LKKSQSNHF